MNRKTRSSSEAFTIVELLIVIVVIGILAAITIVSFNGVANKARIAALQSNMESAYKQIEVAAATTGTNTYPATVTGLDSAVKYYANPTYGGFCASKTDAQNNTYMVTSSNKTPHAGPACNTTTPYNNLTNLVSNPSFEGAALTNNWIIGQRISFVQTTGGSVGSNAALLTRSSTTSGEGYAATQIPTTVGKRYSVSFAIKTVSGNPTMTAAIVNFNQGWSLADNAAIAITSSPTYARYTLSWTAQDTISQLILENISVSATASSVAIDAVIATEGDNSAVYVDPTTRGDWVWTGSAGYSTSTGPAF